LEKQLRLFEWQITEGKRRIARIQKDWESGGSIYTPSEAQQRISEERQKIDRAKNEKTKLELSLRQLAQDKAYEGQLREALERIRDANLSQASFEDKRKIVELLDVNVYPCDDLSGALLSCAVSLELVSHQSISIASPKL
jgi:phage-related protein